MLHKPGGSVSSSHIQFPQLWWQSDSFLPSTGCCFCAGKTISWSMMSSLCLETEITTCSKVLGPPWKRGASVSVSRWRVKWKDWRRRWNRWSRCLVHVPRRSRVPRTLNTQDSIKEWRNQCMQCKRITRGTTDNSRPYFAPRTLIWKATPPELATHAAYIPDWGIRPRKGWVACKADTRVNLESNILNTMPINTHLTNVPGFQNFIVERVPAILESASQPIALWWRQSRASRCPEASSFHLVSRHSGFQTIIITEIN